MTVGEVIALLTTYCSDVDCLLMCRSIYNIEVYENRLVIDTVDGNSSDITIMRGET